MRQERYSGRRWPDVYATNIRFRSLQRLGIAGPKDQSPRPPAKETFRLSRSYFRRSPRLFAVHVATGLKARHLSTELVCRPGLVAEAGLSESCVLPNPANRMRRSLEEVSSWLPPKLAGANPETPGRKH